MTTEEEIPNMEGRSLKESIPVLIELVKNLSNRLDALAADVRGLKEGKHELRIEKKDGIQENIVMQELENEKDNSIPQIGIQMKRAESPQILRRVQLMKILYEPR